MARPRGRAAALSGNAGLRNKRAKSSSIRVALVHRAEPGAAARQAGARQQADGTWVWRECPARVLWDQIMRCAFDHGEPGVLFLDAIQRDDNLSWCETLEATNPCGEQPLPPYGGCCLGSIDLTRFVLRPFEPEARFDMDAFAALCAVAVRMLDDVLDVSPWPLPQQHEEAMRKRRIGLGFTGLGDALVMLNLRYDSRPAREMAARVARCLRDAAYGASVALAAERGAYPLFDAQRCLAPPAFASRLPLALKQRIRAHGLRNSHLLSIAPTGTISLAFADNASPGIEPAFAWSYLRQRRDAHGRVAEHRVEDRAWRLYRSLKGPHAALTSAFVGALAISAIAQVLMVAAVAPFIDASISKTVNLPAAALYADAQKLYHQAWLLGLKGLTIHRPNMVTGSVLSG
jgi:ribonucleoside-diphosphate reductase alpha chain